jgi:hypothetical protein
MVDESGENFSQNESVVVSDDNVSCENLSQPETSTPIGLRSVNETKAETVINDKAQFEGFGPDTLPYNRSERLNQILKKQNNNYSLAVDIGSTESVNRQLRSRGPVPDQPRVQRLILERVKQKGKNNNNESA